MRLTKYTYLSISKLSFCFLFAISHAVGLEYETVEQLFSDIWINAVTRYFVNPYRLIAHACEQLIVTYPKLTYSQIATVRDMLLAVYDEPIGLYPEVEKAMTGLAAMEIGMGVVTHAPKWWTKKKIGWTGIDRFLIKGSVYVVDENGAKNADSWLRAAHYYTRDPLRTVVVGDNLKADANAGGEAGFAQSYWLVRPNEKTWTIIRDGTMGDGVRKINQLDELLSELN